MTVIKSGITLLSTVLLSGCLQDTDNSKDENMSVIDYETKTYCIGRFLVDVPATLKPITQGYASIGGVRIKYLGELGKDDFRLMLDTRAAEIRGLEKPEWGESALLWTKRIDDLFIIAYNADIYNNIGGDLESYFRRGDHSYKLSKGFVYESLKRHIDNLKYIEKNTIYRDPEQPLGAPIGACIPYGFYKGAVVSNENYHFGFRDVVAGASTPNLRIGFTLGDNITSWPYKKSMEISGTTKVANLEGFLNIAKKDRDYARDSGWNFIFWGGRFSEQNLMGIKAHIRFQRLRKFTNAEPYGFDQSYAMWHQILKSARPINKILY